MTIEEVIAALKAIIDGATAEGRDITDEEASRYEQLEKDLAVAKRSQELRSHQTAYETPLRTDLGVHVGTEKRSAEEKAFESYLRTGHASPELRAQSEGTGSAGGFLVPEGFRLKITERLKAFGGIRSVSEVLNTGSGNPLPWPTNDDTANLGEIVAEAATFAAGADLVLGEKTLGAYKYGAGGASNLPLKVSIELLQDSAFDVESWVANKLAVRIGRAQAAHFATGTGVGQPQGLLTGLTSTVTVVSNTVGLTYANLVTMSHTPDIAYREIGESVWVMSDGVLSLIEQLVDTTGRPILQMSTDGIAGRPERTILGYRVIVDNAMPATYTSGVKTVAFGNIKEAYVIRDVKDVSIAVLRELYAPNGQVGFLGWARADALVQDANAATVASGV